MRARARRRTAALVIVSLAVGLLLPDNADALFTDSDPVGGNTFTAGDIEIQVQDSGAAMFNLGGMKPSDPTVSKCVAVKNTGVSTIATLKLYGGTTTGTGLGTYLNLTVMRGSFTTTPAFPSCSTFTSAGTVYSGTLTGFPSAVAGELSDGGGSLASGASRVYEFDLSLQDTSAAQGLTVTLPFTFDASS